MLWSPIVKSSRKNSKYNQLEDVKEIKRHLEENRDVQLQIIINHEYQKCLNELREFASNQSKEMQSPVLRVMQIEEKLKKHLKTNIRNR